MNQKVPGSHRILPDYLARDPWPRLHQTVQMFDDREDLPQMQLKEGESKHPINFCLAVKVSLLR